MDLEIKDRFPSYDSESLPLHLKVDIYIKKILFAENIPKNDFKDNIDYYTWFLCLLYILRFL